MKKAAITALCLTLLCAPAFAGELRSMFVPEITVGAITLTQLDLYKVVRVCRGCVMAGWDLSLTNLDYSDLTGSNLSGANFTGSSLQNTSFKAITMTGATFTGANLSGSDLSDAVMDGCKLDRSIINSHAKIRPKSAVGADFSGANLQNSYLRGDFSGANFYRANLMVTDPGDGFGETTSDITGSLAGANLAGADFRYRIRIVTDMKGATITGAKFGYMPFEASDLSYLPLNKAILNSKTMFVGCNMTGVDMSGMILRNMTIRGCNLQGADFTGTDLTNAKLEYEASTTGAIVSGAILNGTVLRGSPVTEAQLATTASMIKTICPDGTVNAAGAHCEGHCLP